MGVRVRAVAIGIDGNIRPAAAAGLSYEGLPSPGCWIGNSAIHVDEVEW